jgi:hypothetical protein
MGLAPLYKCNGNDNDSGASPALCNPLGDKCNGNGNDSGASPALQLPGPQR